MRGLTRVMLVTILISTLPATIANAGDGVLEINQTCAAGPGCFPGDSAGFPVTILSGSYVLTSDLVVPELVDGITTGLSADPSTFPSDVDVTIDLNGFQISSTTTCTAGPVDCNPRDGSIGYAIRIFAGPYLANGLVHNGFISGMAGIGVYCYGLCIVRDLVISEVGEYGVYGVWGTVSDVKVFLVENTGILMGGGTVENCNTVNTGVWGIYGGGTIKGNRTQVSASYGIYGTSLAVIAENTISNTPTGIRCETCVARDNRINASSTGIDFEDTAGVYGGNVIIGDTQDLLNDGSAVQDGVNLCSGAPCP